LNFTPKHTPRTKLQKFCQHFVRLWLWMAPGFDDLLAIHRMYDLLLFVGQVCKPHHYSGMVLGSACHFGRTRCLPLGRICSLCLSIRPRAWNRSWCGHMDWSDISSLGWCCCPIHQG